MRIITPRATPVVRAPAPSVPPPPELREAPPLLHSPVSIITPVNEVELREGSMLIGRLPECDLMIDDALVSRMHARLSVRDDAVVVEDMHSTNGIYVNGMRITHSAVLREGDRLLIGTTEISLFEARPTARVAPLRIKRDATPSLAAPRVPSFGPARAPMPTTLPAKQRESFGRLDLHLEDLPRNPPQPESTPTSRPAELHALHDRNVPATARADALEVIGALADRLVGSGNLDEACRVLSSHLTRILQGATAGLTVPDEVCRLASRHALSLARWTGRSSWIDYVVELHLVARRAMSAQTYPDFESALLSLGDFDHHLLAYYIESLRDERSLLTAEERPVLERLMRLAER
jgi:pSer/pThr/pTyr-binding forkhead associated (FHA) protein